MDVAGWLDGLGLGEHAEAFRDGKIDAVALTLLTSEDLRRLRDEGARSGMKLAISALESALDSAP